MDHRAILEALSDAVLVADVGGAITYANPAVAPLFGVGPDALVGRAVESLLPAVAQPGGGAGGPRVARTPAGRDVPVEVARTATRVEGRDVAVWVLRRSVAAVAPAPPGIACAPAQAPAGVVDALAALIDAAVQINAHPDSAHVARVVVDTLVGRLGGAAARLWAWDCVSARRVLQAWAGSDPTLDAVDLAGAGDVRFPETGDLGLGDVVRTRRARVITATPAGSSAGTTTKTSDLPAWFVEARLAGVVLQPLVFGDQLVGVLGYVTRQPLAAETLQAITALAWHAGAALHDVASDLSARLQIEALAREAHARTGEFEAIVSNMPDAVLVVRDARVVFANRTAARMVGLDSPADLLVSLEEFARTAGIRRLDGTAVPTAELILAPVLRGEVITGAEYRLTNVRTGLDVWFQLAGAPLRDPAGNLQGGVVVATEITRLKQLEQSKDEWLAIAAHELRTPLTPITLHLQMAQRRLHMGRALSPEVVDKALGQVQRLARLVNGLLDVTRLQAGQLDLCLEEVDLRDVVEGIIERVRHGAPRHTLVVDVGPGAAVVRGDRTRLDEVIAALVDNAIKYSPDGGEVWVRVSADGRVARVEVRDAGIGIAPEERAEIFERYFRGGALPHRQFGGLGLGLWIAGKVVQRHGGSIELESTPGHGSTFTVVLPVAAAAADLAPAAVPLRTRVLVVDDDTAVLEAVEELLGDDGYDVRVATSGPEALAVARAWRPDVMLLDLRMPGMDGWEVRRRFATDPTLAQVPVVLVSADRDARVGAAGMDVQGFIAKPFGLDEIERLLDRVTGRPGVGPHAGEHAAHRGGVEKQ